MSNLSQFFAGGGVKPTSIINGGVPVPGANDRAYSPAIVGSNEVASGVCTAATLKTILSVSGRGALTFLSYANVDTTSRTLRFKITLDGVVILDSTSSTITQAKYAFILGLAVNTSTSLSGLGYVVEGTPLLFDSSLLIEFASSLTETNKTNIGYVYYER